MLLCFGKTKATCFRSSALRTLHWRNISGLPRQAQSLEVPRQNGAGKPLKLTILPILHGLQSGPGSGQEAADAIKALAPRQVMVELCQKRYGQVLSSMMMGVPLGPPSKLDLLGNIHGGLLQHELGPILQAARVVGAAVLPIDRSQAATRSRVAHRLWHPRLLQGLLSYAAYLLRRQRDASSMALPSDAEELRRQLEQLCPAAHDVLIDERSFYLAQQVSATAFHGDMVVVCSAPMCAHLVARLQKALQMENPEAGAQKLLQLAKRNVPVWPLYLFAYGIVPAGISAYMLLSAWESFLAPALEVTPAVGTT